MMVLEEILSDAAVMAAMVHHAEKECLPVQNLNRAVDLDLKIEGEDHSEKILARK